MTDKKTFSYPGDGKIRDMVKQRLHGLNYGMGDPTVQLNADMLPFSDPTDIKVQQAIADAVDAMRFSLRSQYVSALSTGVDSDMQLTATQIRMMRDQWDTLLSDAILGVIPQPDPPPMTDVLNCNIDWTIIPKEFVIRFGRDIAATWVNAGNPDRFVFNCADDLRLGSPFDAPPLHQTQYGIEFLAQKFLDRDDDGKDYFHHLRLVPAGKDDMQKIIAWLVANT